VQIVSLSKKNKDEFIISYNQPEIIMQGNQFIAVKTNLGDILDVVGDVATVRQGNVTKQVILCEMTIKGWVTDARITEMKDIHVGDYIIIEDHRSDSTNLARILSLEEENRLAAAVYVDPSDVSKIKSGSKEFSILKSDLEVGSIAYCRFFRAREIKG